MGKKTKVDINGTPLEGITIGQIKESKYGWIGTIILFALFIGVIYFLPELSKYYQEFINGNTTSNEYIPVNNTINNELSTDNETEERPSSSDSLLYSFAEDIIIEKENLVFSNVNIVNNVITMNVKNNGESSISLENLELYLVAYDNNNEEKNVINTIALSASIISGHEITLTFPVKQASSYYEIKKITEEDYTYIVLDADENNNATLVCQNDSEILTYSFINDKLKGISQKVTALKSDSNYDSLYNKYHTIVVKYGDITGVKTSLSTNDVQMDFSLEIDYNSFTDNIDNKYYFEKGESSRIINFKMESKLFECR